MLLTRRQRPTQRVFEIRLRHPRRLRQSPVLNEFRECRSRRDARNTAVGFIADLFEVIFLDANGKASNVATCLVAGFPEATGGIQLASVAGPYEMFYDPRIVVVSH